MTTLASTGAGQGTPPAHTEAPVQQPKKPLTPARVVTYVFLIVVALLWLFPVVWAVLASLRDYQYTAQNGYISLGGWTLDN